jgi:hypothetical protein
VDFPAAASALVMTRFEGEAVQPVVLVALLHLFLE